MAVRSNLTTETVMILLTLSLSLTLVSGQQQLNCKLQEQLLAQGRSLFANGYPELGVPKLDPWKVQHFTMRLRESSASVDVNIEATDLNIWNLKTFEVDSLRSSIDPLQANISTRISIPVLRITADYKMNGTIMVVYPVRGNGKMELTLLDVVADVTATLNNALAAIEDLDVQLTVRKLQARLTGTAGLVNTLLNQHGANLINGKRDEISAAIKGQLLPQLNNYLAAAAAGAAAEAQLPPPPPPPPQQPINSV